MTGVEMIAKERARQIISEGWSVEHDRVHTNYQLSDAAVSYATAGHGGPYSHPRRGNPPESWPWDAEWWKPSPDPIRNLVRAGALIAAEIDRLQDATVNVDNRACPNCGRLKARSLSDVMLGHCPKWWAVRDPDAVEDCQRAAEAAERS